MTTSITPVICRHCRRVLNHYADEHGVAYIHATQDQPADGHQPEPIPMPEGYNEGRCDFCNTDQPGFVLPARDFQVPGGHMSLGNWAVCAECKPLIERDEWSKLTRRVLEKRAAMGGMTEMFASVLPPLYRRLRKAISGPIRSIRS